MTFFRIKKVKGKEYAYVVENRWKRVGSRQKVKAYLGRAYRFDFKNDVDFLHFVKTENYKAYLNSRDENNIVRDLIEWEFLKHNINSQEFKVDLSDTRVKKGERNIVLLLNDGFMCNLTLKNLLDFKANGDEEDDGYRFARAFVEAGIKVPHEIFIGLFGKLYKDKSSFH